MSRDYYCQHKFRQIKVDFVNKTTYTCCAAYPENVNFEWVANNPGQLFNSPVNVHERTQMLNNERSEHCEQNCWQVEDHNQPSYRTQTNGQERVYTDVVTFPKSIDVGFHADCNNSCIYCCREFSTAWMKDLISNGDYQFTNYNSTRFKQQPNDQQYIRVGQKNSFEQDEFRILFDEVVSMSKTANDIILTGGEPLLNNAMYEFLDTLTAGTNMLIKISSGLTAPFNRIEKLVKVIKEKKLNVQMFLSFESVGDLAEFNRYGTVWALAEKKIHYLIDNGIDITFRGTLVNTNVFGFQDFYNRFCNHKMKVIIANQPSMLLNHILDDDTKEKIYKTLNVEDSLQTKILNSIERSPTETEKINCRELLIQFTQRRNLNFDVLPNSFIKWLEL